MTSQVSTSSRVYKPHRWASAGMMAMQAVGVAAADSSAQFLPVGAATTVIRLGVSVRDGRAGGPGLLLSTHVAGGVAQATRYREARRSRSRSSSEV